MINICFSDITPANLRESKYILNKSGISTDIADNLLSITLQLDQGNIPDNGIGTERLNFLKQLHKDYIYGENVPSTYDGGFARSVNAIKKIEKGVADGEEFRIWYSEENSEYCAFCWLISFFEEINAKNKIVAIKLPSETMSTHGKYERRFSSASFSPEELLEHISKQNIVSKSLKNFHANQWTNAKKENASLRIVLHGNIVSVNDDFYDSAMMIEIDKYSGLISEGKLVSMCMVKLGLTDIFVGKRIEHMIKKGLFEVVSQPSISAPFYCKKIRKTDK